MERDAGALMWARRDDAATRAARKAKRFVDRRSWIGVRSNGDMYLRLHGRDKEAQRERLFALWDGNCYLCGQPVARGDEDLEHMIPLGRGGDDSDINQDFCHSMFSKFPCHRNKTAREVQLKWLPPLETWTHGGEA